MPPCRVSQGLEGSQCLLLLQWGAVASLLKKLPCRGRVRWPTRRQIKQGRHDDTTSYHHTAPPIWDDRFHRQELIPSPCPTFYSIAEASWRQKAVEYSHGTSSKTQFLSICRGREFTLWRMHYECISLPAKHTCVSDQSYLFKGHNNIQ